MKIRPQFRAVLFHPILDIYSRRGWNRRSFFDPHDLAENHRLIGGECFSQWAIHACQLPRPHCQWTVPFEVLPRLSIIADATLRVGNLLPMLAVDAIVRLEIIRQIQCQRTSRLSWRFRSRFPWAYSNCRST